MQVSKPSGQRPTGSMGYLVQMRRSNVPFWQTLTISLTHSILDPNGSNWKGTVSLFGSLDYICRNWATNSSLRLLTRRNGNQTCSLGSSPTNAHLEPYQIEYCGIEELSFKSGVYSAYCSRWLARDGWPLWKPHWRPTRSKGLQLQHTFVLVLNMLCIRAVFTVSRYSDDENHRTSEKISEVSTPDRRPPRAHETLRMMAPAQNIPQGAVHTWQALLSYILMLAIMCVRLRLLLYALGCQTDCFFDLIPGIPDCLSYLYCHLCLTDRKCQTQ